MSFGFQFDQSQMDEEYLSSSQPQQPFSTASTSAQALSTDQAPFASHSVGEMLHDLPSRISYSTIGVSLAGGERTQRLLRRDLFDARFQMLLDGDDDDDDEEEEEEEEEEDEQGESGRKGVQGNGTVATQGSVDAESDLIPGVYEGGLKTWECALDLVETLDALHATSGGAEADGSWSSRLNGKNVLELGCGTALPTLFLLSQVLKDPIGEKLNLTLHLADYNAAVLSLVTLPNLLLTWYASPASSTYRTTLEAEHLRQERHELTRRGQDHFDTSAQAGASEEGELAISDELLSSFSASLEQRGIGLKFYSGAWPNFPKTLGKMHITLTSETIYSLESLPALVELLSRYAKPEPEAEAEAEAEAGLVLVAAKVIYFGVGGGVESFKQTLGQLTPTAKVEPLHSVTKGVGRTVLSVTF